MDFNRLAAKQKKVKEFESNLTSLIDNPALKSRMSGLINDYKSILYQAWKSPQTVTDIEVQSLERELDEVHEEIRLNVKRI